MIDDIRLKDKMYLIEQSREFSFENIITAIKKKSNSCYSSTSADIVLSHVSVRDAVSNFLYQDFMLSKMNLHNIYHGFAIRFC